MSLTTHSKNTQVQALFARDLNPLYAAFVKETNPEDVLDGQNRIGLALQKIRSLEPGIDLSDVERKVEKKVQSLFQANEVAFSEAKAPSDPQAPRGIVNAGANCWANSLIHMLVGSESMMRKIALCEDPRVRKIACILEAFQAGKKIDSQAFRLAIVSLATRKVDGIPASASAQIDVIQAYQLLFDLLDDKLVFDRTRADPLADNAEEAMTQETTTEIDFDLQNNTRFREMFDAFFVTPRDDARFTLKKLTSAPDDLVFQARRFAYDLERGQIKLKTPIQGVPQEFSLAPERTSDGIGADYTFSSCIIHIGDSPSKGGHYVTLEKRGDTFFHINDESVFRWEEGQWVLIEGHEERNPIHNPAALAPDPEGMMAQGYLFHYAKVGGAPLANRVGTVAPGAAMKITVVAFAFLTFLYFLMNGFYGTK